MNGWSRCATETAISVQAENRATDLDRLVQIVGRHRVVGPSRDEETRGVGTWEEP
jgi:hypothetical protein